MVEVGSENETPEEIADKDVNAERADNNNDDDNDEKKDDNKDDNKDDKSNDTDDNVAGAAAVGAIGKTENLLHPDSARERKSIIGLNQLHMEIDR